MLRLSRFLVNSHRIGLCWKEKTEMNEIVPSFLLFFFLFWFVGERITRRGVRNRTRFGRLFWFVSSEPRDKRNRRRVAMPTAVMFSEKRKMNESHGGLVWFVWKMIGPSRCPFSVTNRRKKKNRNVAQFGHSSHFFFDDFLIVSDVSLAPALISLGQSNKMLHEYLANHVTNVALGLFLLVRSRSASILRGAPPRHKKNGRRSFLLIS